MRPEYDFSKGVRGKYAARFAERSNVVVLDADVAAHFPDSKSVNDALRKLLGLRPKKRRSS
jgi:methylphosphotriester-DNA--protein-cysteine methyltransferase